MNANIAIMILIAIHTRQKVLVNSTIATILWKVLKTANGIHPLNLRTLEKGIAIRQDTKEQRTVTCVVKAFSII